VHIFLARLDDDFKQICGEILRKEPVPKLEECYALICCESIRSTMMNGETEHFETSAMVAQNRFGKYQQERIRYNHQKNGLINLNTNPVTVITTAKLKANALNWWDIQTGGIIIVIHERSTQ